MQLRLNKNMPVLLQICHLSRRAILVLMRKEHSRPWRNELRRWVKGGGYPLKDLCGKRPILPSIPSSYWKRVHECLVVERLVRGYDELAKIFSYLE